jgi:hypothetical protein
MWRDRGSLQLAEAGPGDLDADAEQQKGGQPHHHIRAVVAKSGNRGLGKAVTNIDRGGDSREAGNGHPGEHRKMSEIDDLLWPLATEGNGDRDCSRSNGERHGQWVKSIAIRSLRGLGSALIPQLLSALEERPPKRSQHHTAGNGQDRQCYAKKLQHIRTDKQRTEQQEESIYRHPEGKRMALPLSVVSRQGEENWSVADRVNNREQAGVNQKKDMREMLHQPSHGSLVASAVPHDAEKGPGVALQSDRQAEL